MMLHELPIDTQKAIDAAIYEYLADLDPAQEVELGTAPTKLTVAQADSGAVVLNVSFGIGADGEFVELLHLDATARFGLHMVDGELILLGPE